MDKIGKEIRRRVRFPPKLVEAVCLLPPEERNRRLFRYLEEHGEEVGPRVGYGPQVWIADDHRPPAPTHQT